MANQKLQDLTEETAPAAADIVPITDGGTQRLRKLPFSFFGLVPKAEDADANITGEVGRLHVVDMNSGTPFTASRDFVLPVAANVETGERVGVYLKDGDPSFELLLKSGAAGDLINEVDHSTTEWSRLFITGEMIVFYCRDGATADWIVEYDGRISAKALLLNTASSQSLTSNTFHVVTWTSSEVEQDIGGMIDLTNELIIPRRDGLIIMCAGAKVDDLDDAEFFIVRILKDQAGTPVELARDQSYASTGDTGADFQINASFSTAKFFDVSADVDLVMEVYHNAVDAGVTLTGVSWFSVVEVL